MRDLLTTGNDLDAHGNILDTCRAIKNFAGVTGRKKTQWAYLKGYLIL